MRDGKEVPHRMFTALFRRIMGRVEFSLEGGMYEKLLNESAELGLGIEHIEATPLGVRAQLPARNFRALHAMGRRFGCRVRILKKSGLVFSSDRLFRRRKGVLAGAFLFLLVCFLFKNFIWKVDFYGLSPADSQALRHQLTALSIMEGGRARDEELRRAEQQILLNCPQFAWVSINFVRGRLVVEASDTVPKPQIESAELNDIVAKCDGSIVSMTVYEGNPVKKVGDAVSAGETLVSSVRVGERSKVAAFSHSSAQVIAHVRRSYTSSIPLQYTVNAPTGQQKRYHTLHILGLDIPFYRQLPAEEGHIVQAETEPLVLWGFHLPASLQTVTYLPTAGETVTLSEEAAQAQCRTAILQQVYGDYKKEDIQDIQEECCLENGECQMVMTVSGNMDIAQSAPAAPYVPPPDQPEK